MRGDGAFHRAPRPLLMWLAVVCVVLVLAFFVGIGVSILTAFHMAAQQGRPVPDMSGGLYGVLTGLAALLPAIAAFAQVFSQRHRERMDQQARGKAPDRPFDSSPPSPPGSPTGGLVNNDAIQ